MLEQFKAHVIWCWMKIDENEVKWTGKAQFLTEGEAFKIYYPALFQTKLDTFRASRKPTRQTGSQQLLARINDDQSRRLL